MFNNANVLYKTKFVDGVSTVTRYVQNAGKSDGKENSHVTASKKKPAGGNKRARLEEL